jgi:hypothetical protein
MTPSADPLDQVLLGFSESDAFTIRDACQGVQIFGETGSGKTSGSGRYLAHAYLTSGFGGLVLTAKVDELDLWRRYAQETGRSDDLIVFGEGSDERFNILQYECENDVGGLGLTWNLVELFMTLHGIASHGGGRATSNNDQFWRNELEKLLANSIESLRLAGEKVTFQNIGKLVWSAPQSPEDFASEDWQKESFCFQLNAIIQARSHAGKLSAAEEGDWNVTHDYWRLEYPRVPDKTKSNIIGSLTGMTNVFDRGMLREQLSTTTTVKPDDTFAGKIIVLNLPPKRFHEAGTYTQAIFKYCWQRAVERRKVERDTRPVFLWADEAHHFVNEHDVTFQTTARGARACTVLLTQNLPNYYYYLGGDQSAEALTQSLLGNLTTKIFHNNSCNETNRYASELFAKTWQRKTGYSTSDEAGKTNVQQQSNDELLDQVIPHTFSGLASGGPLNDFEVEAIIHQGGKTFQCSGGNALRTVFHQTA